MASHWSRSHAKVHYVAFLLNMNVSNLFNKKVNKQKYLIYILLCG